MELSPALSLALRVLAIDRATIAVCRLLDDARAEHVLLKGPTTAHLLYAIPVERGYADIDLLVRRQDLLHACNVLSARGLQAP